MILKIKTENERPILLTSSFGVNDENFSTWIKKGYLVTVEGRLQTRSYENQQGQKVYVTEVNVSNFDNLQPRDHSNTSSQSQDF